jgi:hypothetical protein
MLDLRPDVLEVEDQGPIGSCTAFGWHKAVEVMHERAGNPINLSPAYLYYHSRMRGGFLGDGAHMRHVAAVIQDRGVCTEQMWRYDISKINVQPPAECDAEAQNFRALSVEQLGSQFTPDLYISYLKRGIPVVFVIFVSEDMIKSAGKCKDWTQTQWERDPSKSPYIGLHCVMCIGYDLASRRWLLQNSWSKEWGDLGFFGMPFDYMAQDAWVMPEILGVDPVPARDTEDMFDTLMDWAEVQFSLGKSDTRRFAQYLYREYGGVYLGLDTKRSQIVRFDGSLTDFGSIDYWWGQYATATA